MSKHTPAPWRYTNHADKRHKEFAIMHAIEDGGKIGSLYAGFGDHFDWETQEANARLIAAAPELLEALQATTAELQGYLFDGGASSETKAIVDNAVAAIRKALGIIL